MVWSRDIAKDAAPPRGMGEAFLKMLSPLAPHLAEELWERLGTPRRWRSPWPVPSRWLVDETITLVVQVNGTSAPRWWWRRRRRGDGARGGLADENVRKHLEGKQRGR